MAVKRTTKPIPPAKSDVQRERSGVTLLTPFGLAETDKPKVPAYTIATAAEYEEADEKLRRVLVARRQWRAEWYGEDDKSGIIPLQTAVLNKQYSLIRKIDKPLEVLETALRAGMKAFKLDEQRQLQAAAEEEARLQREIDAAEERERNARTPQVADRARAMQQDLMAKQEFVREATAPPVIAFNSSTRKKKKWRVSNMMEFVTGCLDGTYDLSWLEVSESARKLLDLELKSNPETLAAFPGIEVYDDLDIVGR